jgi:hypothetical protein
MLSSPSKYKVRYALHSVLFSSILFNKSGLLLCSSPITIAGIQQTVAEALLGLIQEEGTANELIVGLESLSIGDLANNDSLEDPVAEDCAMFDGNTVKNDAVYSNARDGNGAGGDASLNDLQQMGWVLH